MDSQMVIASFALPALRVLADISAADIIITPLGPTFKALTLMPHHFGACLASLQGSDLIQDGSWAKAACDGLKGLGILSLLAAA